MNSPARGNWLLYLNTIRYLKPRQIFWRLWRLFPTMPAPGAGPAPALRNASAALAALPGRRQSLTAADTFRFLNQEGRVQSAADWNDPKREALWLYNLHYFDDLCADDTEARCAWHEALIARWIAENPVGKGVGWDPYPTSLRIVNWIKWAKGNRGQTPVLKPQYRGLSPISDASLATQVRWLTARIEWHLLGNHLLANAKALVFAGAFFDTAEAQGWLSKGCGIFAAELDEQVLADGGHFERSPMYHAIVLEDVLDLLNLSQCYPGVLPQALVAALRAKAALMLHWAQTMTHPDGEIAFFNDAAMGIVPPLAQLVRYAERLGIAPPGAMEGPGARGGTVEAAVSGYVRFENDPIVVLFDAAPIGPDYLPGHAHADTLSFELSWGTQRVICNSGISRYGTGPERLWERSTAAHNTVEIDAENSSEVWSGFRVARRAYPLGRSVELTKMRAACAHDGYLRLPGRPVHRRTIEVGDSALTWADEITGDGEHRVVGRIPLHPDVKAHRMGDDAWQLVLPSAVKLDLTIAGTGLTIGEEEGRYSPEFGITHTRRVLNWSFSGRLPVAVKIRLKTGSV